MGREEQVVTIANEAGDFLLELFESGTRSQEADIAGQKLIVPQLQTLELAIPVLAEEDIEDLNILLATDDVVDLPSTYWSVDPLDGSAVFDNKCSEWAISIALIEDHRPVLVIVCFPRFDMTVVAVRGEGVRINDRQVKLETNRLPEQWLVGIDLCKTTDEDYLQNTVLPLTKKFRFVRNFPTVASNLELLLGHIGLWTSDRVRNWDIAAMALAVEEAGGIIHQLDGKPINWQQVRMPPLV